MTATVTSSTTVFPDIDTFFSSEIGPVTLSTASILSTRTGEAQYIPAQVPFGILDGVGPPKKEDDGVPALQQEGSKADSASKEHPEPSQDLQHDLAGSVSDTASNHQHGQSFSMENELVSSAETQGSNINSPNNYSAPKDGESSTSQSGPGNQGQNAGHSSQGSDSVDTSASSNAASSPKVSGSHGPSGEDSSQISDSGESRSSSHAAEGDAPQGQNSAESSESGDVEDDADVSGSPSRNSVVIPGFDTVAGDQDRTGSQTQDSADESDDPSAGRISNGAQSFPGSHDEDETDARTSHQNHNSQAGDAPEGGADEPSSAAFPSPLHSGAVGEYAVSVLQAQASGPGAKAAAHGRVGAGAGAVYTAEASSSGAGSSSSPSASISVPPSLGRAEGSLQASLSCWAFAIVLGIGVVAWM